MAISLLTPLSTPPGRSQDDFDTAMATTLAEIDTMVDQLNLALDAINIVLPNLELVPGAAAAAATATAARDVVLAARDVVLQALDTTLTARDAAAAAAASLDISTLISKAIGTAAGDLIYFSGASVPARLAKGSNGQILTLVSGLPAWAAAPQSGTSKWTSLVAATDFSTTAPSTSTVTMVTNQTANIKPGMAIRFKLSGTYYYAICTAIAAGLLTLAGAPLTTSAGALTELAYSTLPGMVESITLTDPGAWADAADTALIANDLLMALRWGKAPAALVRIEAYTRTTDTGASFPRVNARLGATTTDYVSTSNSNAGLALAASATWYSTVVDIDPAKYAVVPGTAIELRTDANGSNDDARDLVVVLTFVYA